MTVSPTPASSFQPDNQERIPFTDTDEAPTDELQELLDAGNGEEDDLTVGPNDEMGRQDFLQLLTTQLQVQDPLNPLEAEEMAAQLAQFSSVEQLLNINNTLTEQGNSQDRLADRIDSSVASNLLGKRVQAAGQELEWTGQESVPVSFEVDDSASEATVTISNADGQEVYSQNLGSLSEGDHEFVWDGRDGDGQELPPGSYTFSVEAQDSNGDRVDTSTFLSGRVSRVSFTGEGTKVQVGDAKIPLDQIENVRE